MSIVATSQLPSMVWFHATLACSIEVLYCRTIVYFVGSWNGLSSFSRSTNLVTPLWALASHRLCSPVPIYGSHDLVEVSFDDPYGQRGDQEEPDNAPDDGANILRSEVVLW
ncbi:hypothetical protein PG994_014494 [Apiospora phragmitis]|uniref:Uncharacterized protein n=1 Tax=Apiospora phragmitis TaxID=2905665 RepID=A0ABR1T4I1_9PEZI